MMGKESVKSLPLTTSCPTTVHTQPGGTSTSLVGYTCMSFHSRSSFVPLGACSGAICDHCVQRTLVLYHVIAVTDHSDNSTDWPCTM